MARSLGRSLSQRGGNRSHLRQAARRRDETANQAGALRAPGHVRSVRCGKAGVRPPCCSRRKASAHLAVLALEELDEVARLVEADAIVYGSPTYMGGPAWQFKKFADATSKPWFVQLASLTPGAGYGVSTSRPTVACSLISRQPGTASSRAGASASRQLQETGALLHQRPATADAFDDAVEAFDLLLAEAVVLGPAEQLQPGPAAMVSLCVSAFLRSSPSLCPTRVSTSPEAHNGSSSRYCSGCVSRRRRRAIMAVVIESESKLLFTVHSLCVQAGGWLIPGPRATVR